MMLYVLETRVSQRDSVQLCMDIMDGLVSSWICIRTSTSVTFPDPQLRSVVPSSVLNSVMHQFQHKNAPVYTPK